FYLHSLSLICRRLGRPALPEVVYVTPCGGTSMVPKLASLFLGQGARPMILLDGDSAGKIQRDKLMRELYVGHDDQLVLLDLVLGIPDCEIEDLVGEATILAAVGELIGRPVVLVDADRGNGGIVAHLKSAAARIGVELLGGWKPEIARQIAARSTL